MITLWFAGTLSLIVALVVAMLTYDQVRERQDRRRAIRDWNTTVSNTTGMVWNPATRHYEHPPGTDPYDH